MYLSLNINLGHAIAHNYEVVHCFTGDHLILGITVNGLWIVSGKENTHMRTYIGKIAIKVRHVTITVTPESITFGGKNVRWRRHATRSRGHVRVDVVKGIHLYVRIGRGVTLHIVRHLHLLTNPLKIDHLGFYVEKGTGLSTTTDGIIG